MSFWSGETLRRRVATEGIFSPRPKDEEERFDANSYRLTIGEEVFVTPHGANKDPEANTKKKLKPGEAFTIPAGQFAYILTEETIKVPKDSMAFISIRSGWKFKGLVNISGFHVDPGYAKKLIFSVFNAGPQTIELHRGDQIFVIWFAYLDLIEGQQLVPKETLYSYGGRGGYDAIPHSLIDATNRTLYSQQALSEKIKDHDAAISRLELFYRALIVSLVAGVTLFLLGRLGALPLADTRPPTSLAPVSSPAPPPQTSPQ